jgi:heat shock protein HslJ
MLSNLNEKVINKNEEGLASFIVFSGDKTFKGFAGCNKFQGNYKNNKGKFTFSNIGATKMLCENNNNEGEFLKALNKVINYKIIDNQLMLMDKTKTIAVFEAEKAK